MDAVDVVGAGGIGCAVGYELAAAGVPVRMVDARVRKVEAGNRAGRPGVEFVAFDDWRPIPGRVVLLCTKCYDNAAVLARLPADTPLVPVQNGYDPQLEAFGHSVEAVASFVVRCETDGVEPVVTRPGDLHIGPRQAGQTPPHLVELIDCLKRATRFRTKPVPAIGPIKATKLMYNAAISPLAAASGIDNGALLSDPTARKLFFALLQENYHILTAAGVELGTVGPLPPRVVARILQRPWVARLLARFFEPSLRRTYCSMAGEIETGRTEIENYTGHLLRLAGDTVPCPLNRRVYELVKRMEREKAKPSRDVLDLL